MPTPDIENHNEWNTPPDFLSVVRRLDVQRRIGLDPCSNATSIVNARTSYTKRDDGLAQSWRGHGLVFVNPPYDFVDPWVAKGVAEFVERGMRAPLRRSAVQSHDASRDQLLMLVTSKTDTRWFHDFALRFDRQCFVRGRLKFLRPVRRVNRVAGNGRFASLVLYAGEHGDAFETLFAPLGWVPR